MQSWFRPAIDLDRRSFLNLSSVLNWSSRAVLLPVLFDEGEIGDVLAAAFLDDALAQVSQIRVALDRICVAARV